MKDKSKDKERCSILDLETNSLKHVLFFLLSITILEFTAFGQKGKRETLDLPSASDCGCIYKPKYSAAKRIQFYPFNVADSIKLVSFRHHVHNYPMKENAVAKDSLIETVVLKKYEVDQLTNILFNNFYKTKAKITVITNCYEPRNAILFIDKKGILRDYILICFHCNRYELGSNKLKAIGDECYGKTEKLRTFFVGKGLLFGTDRSVDSYPGETNKDPGIPPAFGNN